MNKPSRRSRGTVTIEDVARAAGVSAMTVSRVINKEKNVRDKTRDRVLKAIKELKYSPNMAARSLAAGEATHIGLLYSNPSAAYLSQFLVGALDGARKAGIHLGIEACEGEDEASHAEAAKYIAAADVEGVILPPPLSESVPILTELALAEMPVVTVAMGKLYENALNVRIDDFAAAAEITNYLINLGHRRVALIKGHPQQIASAERERGFRAAVNAAGLDPADIAVEQGYFTFRSGLEAAEKLLDNPRRPTAIFASNDDMAAGVLHVAHEMGIDVPGKLSVAGFDNIPESALSDPPLTTVEQPIRAMGRRAVEMLIALIRGEEIGERNITLATRIVVRASTRAR